MTVLHPLQQGVLTIGRRTRRRHNLHSCVYTKPVHGRKMRENRAVGDNQSTICEEYWFREAAGFVSIPLGKPQRCGQKHKFSLGGLPSHLSIEERKLRSFAGYTWLLRCSTRLRRELAGIGHFSGDKSDCVGTRPPSRLFVSYVIAHVCQRIATRRPAIQCTDLGE